MRLREWYKRFRHWTARYDSPIAFGLFCIASTVLAYIAPSYGFSEGVRLLMALCAFAFGLFSVATAIYITKKMSAETSS